MVMAMAITMPMLIKHKKKINRKMIKEPDQMIRFLFKIFLSLSLLKLTKIYKKPLVFFLKHSMLKHAKIKSSLLDSNDYFWNLL